MAGGSRSRSSLIDEMCESTDNGDETKSSLNSEQSIIEVLELYSHILDKMRIKRNTAHVGKRLRVMITSAEEETFFWGQVAAEVSTNF